MPVESLHIEKALAPDAKYNFTSPLMNFFWCTSINHKHQLSREMNSSLVFLYFLYSCFEEPLYALMANYILLFAEYEQTNPTAYFAIKFWLFVSTLPMSLCQQEINSYWAAYLPLSAFYKFIHFISVWFRFFFNYFRFLFSFFSFTCVGDTILKAV